jgi:hypothetical protein
VGPGRPERDVCAPPCRVESAQVSRCTFANNFSPTGCRFPAKLKRARWWGGHSWGALDEATARQLDCMHKDADFTSAISGTVARRG